MRKIALALFLSMVIVATALTCISQALAQSKELQPQEWKFSNFLPPGHWSNWCNSWFLDELEKRSNGKIKTKLFIGQALGKAQEHYGMVMNGLVQLGEYTTGFGPGVFPLSEVLQIPFSWDRSLLGSIVANDMLKKGYLDETLRKDVKVIAINLTEPLRIFTRKPITTMAELKGLRLRVAGGMDVDTVKSLGAAAISMPLPEVYPALEKGVIDGGVYGFPSALDFRYAEATKHVMDIPLGIAVHLIIMNKKLYDSLPSDTKAMIDELSWEMVMHWSNTIDRGDSQSRVACVEKHGVKIADVKPAEVEKMKAATADVAKNWIAKMKEKGLPGQENYDAMITRMRNYGIIPDQEWVKNRALAK